MSPSTTQRSCQKDIQQLYRMIEASTDGQASIIGVTEMSVVISLHPKFGYNAHADFTAKIRYPVSYPSDGPQVTFNSPIFHPNIDNTSGDVCLNLLSEWRSCYNLLDVVKALLYLINNPNFDLPNNLFGSLSNRNLIGKKTMRVLAGLPVNGERFAPNKAWCEWAKANGCLPTDEDDDDASGEGEGGVQTTVEAALQDRSDERDAAFTYKTSDDGECDDGGAVFNENVLSYANVRYSVDSDSESRLSLSYGRDDVMRNFEVQRIIISLPTDGSTAGDHSVFYYCEHIGDQSWRREHGSFYSKLLSGDVLHSMQSHPESGQASSVCPWYTFCEQKRYSFESTSTSVYDISFLFTRKTLTRPYLTNDFCPWSYFDGGGTWNILGGLFWEQRRRNWTASTCTEVNLDGNDMALFNTSFSTKDSDSEEEFKEEERKEDDFAEEQMQEDCGVDLTDSEETEEAVSATKELYVCDVEGAERGEECLPGDEGEEVMECDLVHNREETYSSRSSGTYEGDENIWCIPYETFFDMDTITSRLRPRWRWILRQTRWPFRFAPQQTVDLSMHEISIPPWRASAVRLLSDVRNFCTRNRKTKNLILLDPMALSPLSPLLNLMQHSVQPKAHLRGILWMT
uniref:UBIQUITIN_CONJUGAT_2 domain-containing protein n=2 Tax=Mesocestoides corti TaxID=53468 RepID=A0A5K3FKH9_MESCO